MGPGDDIDELADFIEHRMRMSHVYQPVMLMRLLTNRGRASVREIARSILQHDETQIEYYENVTNKMVGRVLRSHEVVSKEGDLYFLSGFESLGDDEIAKLVELCQVRLDDVPGPPRRPDVEAPEAGRGLHLGLAHLRGLEAGEVPL